MITLNTPAPARRDTNPPPVPWRRLAWVSWRQYRMSAAGAVALLGVLALYLLIEGLRIRSSYAATAGCSLSAPSKRCVGAFLLFDNSYFTIAEISAAVLLAVPVLTGVFAGAPILARELETGTFRFAWTQGAGRTRWTLARLTLPALTLTAAAAVFSQLFGWFFYPFFTGSEFAQASGLAPVYFTLTGIAFAAWTLTAFAIGVLAGVLIRRVVPAMAAAMAAWSGLLLSTLLFLRRHYEAPLTTRTGQTGPASWVLTSWWTGPNGQRVTSENQIIKLLNGGPHRGYTQWTIYQPGTRYWHFQLIEGGWLLAVSLLLVAATIWMVRRRAA